MVRLTLGVVVLILGCVAAPTPRATARPQPVAPSVDVLRPSTLAVGPWGFCVVASTGALRCRAAAIGFAGPEVVPTPVGRFRGVAALGASAFCGLRDDGGVVCWPVAARSLSSAPSFAGRYTALAGARSRRGAVCALADDGALDCVHEPLDQPTTVQRLGRGPFTSLQATGADVCALGSQTSMCAATRCATNDVTTCALEAVSVEGALVQIESQPTFGCGLTARGELRCFDAEGKKTAPALEPLPFVQVSTHGSGVVCGLASTGRLMCTHSVPGADERFTRVALTGISAQLVGLRADGSALLPPQLQPLVPADARFTEVVGDEPVCGLRADGQVTCVGNFRLDEAKLTALERLGITRLVASGSDLCAAAGAEATCWGSAPTRSELPPPTRSDGAYGSRPYPGQRQRCTLSESGAAQCEAAAAPKGSFVEMQSGNDFSCGLSASGALTCWGSIQGRPVKAPAGPFKAFALGGLHGCAIDPAGALRCWGSEAAMVREVPQGQFSAIFTGYLDTCAQRVDGAVLCWGASFGALTALPTVSPRHLAVGRSGACAVSAEGRVQCFGQLRW